MDNNNNKWVTVLLVAAVAVIGLGFGFNFIVDKIADRVITKLQKEYSPSPYGPGLDPDRLNVDLLKKKN